jgi:hypothetical protein
VIQIANSIIAYVLFGTSKKIVLFSGFGATAVFLKHGGPETRRSEEDGTTDGSSMGVSPMNIFLKNTGETPVLHFFSVPRCLRV